MQPPRRAFSVAIFARHGGRVLLIHHKRLGTWLPVGGEIEPGETPLEAAARELLEETGLRGVFTACGAIDGSPPGLLGYEEHMAGSKGLHMNFAFVADVPTDQVAPNAEFERFQWVTETSALECPKNVHELVALALASGRHDLIALARTWIARFNARDLDGILALYAPEAIHVSPKLRARRPETRGEVRGHAELGAWWKDCFDRLPGLRYVERALTANDARVFMEYERVNPGEETMLIAEVLRCEGGRIHSSHVFHG